LQKLAADRTIDDSQRATIENGLKAEYARYAQTGQVDYAQMRLDAVKNWAAGHAIPAERILIGEFGVLRPTRNSSGPPDANAANWLGAVAHAARKDRFLWAVFDLDTAYSVVCGNPPNQQICDAYRTALQ
jgi:hypothetical protein